MADGNDSDRDEYVLVTHSDSDQNQTPGEKPEVIAQIKAWLSPTDFDSDTSEFKKHLNAHVSGTGQWILATDQYRRWHDTDEVGNIWLRGIPGSGKSVVAASLVRELQRNGHIVLFFFFRHIIMSNRTPQSLMRDCLSQILDHCPFLQSSLKQVMGAHQEIAEVPIDELWKCFSSALSVMDEVYCVVDALDEMEMGQEKFLQDLVNLGRRYPKSIKLALTSRQLPYLEAHLKGSCLVDLRLDRKNVDRDIAIYISYRLNFANLGEHETDQIKEAICERGKGLFLYARLMMDQCLQSPAKFMLDLETLPDGLGDMYTDLLQQHAIISGTTQEFQILILSWVTHSLRPLRLLELATIIDFLPDRGGLKEHQDAKLAIRSACGPLLEVCEDEVVQIIHHSFTEYLLNMDVTHIQMADEQAQRFPVLDPHHIHTMISRTCIQYLRSGCFNDWTPGDSHFYSPEVPKGLLLRFPFLQYAARYFILHAGKVVNNDSNLWGDLDALLQTESHDFESWKEFWQQGSPQTYENAETSDKVSMLPLHVAAYGGFATYIEYLLAKGADRDSRDRTEKTPLMSAAMEGHSEVARVLLKSNACHDCVDNSGWTAVHYAAKMNRADALEVLLAMGAEPLALRILPKIDQDTIFPPVEWDPETALTLVCCNGHKEALQVMIKHVDTSHLLPGLLHCAADRGRAQILQVLLQNDEVRSHINNTDKNGNTPLYLASGARNVASVKILLQHGADVTARSTGNLENARRQPVKTRIEEMSLVYTPLHGLAHLRNGSVRRNSDLGMTEFIEVLELLLQSGSDINERDGEGRTILFAWSESRDFRSERAVDYVSMLLQHGADASVIDKTGATPLHLFDRWWGGAVNNEKVLKILVKAGADINAATIDGQTPLIASAKRQLMYPSSFDGLNVDFDRQDLEGNTALHYACNSACMEYEHAKEWLARCDPTIRNNAGRFALTNFHWLNGGQGRVDAIALMIEKGLSLETRDYLGRTPLLHFLSSSGRGSVHFVEELLRLGADARAVDYHKSQTQLFFSLVPF